MDDPGSATRCIHDAAGVLLCLNERDLRGAIPALLGWIEVSGDSTPVSTAGVTKMTDAAGTVPEEGARRNSGTQRNLTGENSSFSEKTD